MASFNSVSCKYILNSNYNITSYDLTGIDEKY